MRGMDLAGIKYGRLLVITRNGNRANKILWLCQCDCGIEKTIPGADLRSGHTRSCGCLDRETRPLRNRKHGLRKSLEYKVWGGLKQRCRRERRYKEKKISVCARWKRFENFFIDMGPRPTMQHTVERKDNSKGYTPDNCKWATRQEQNNNRTNNISITFKDETHTASQWSEITGIPYMTIVSRHNRGWPDSLIPLKHSYKEGRTIARKIKQTVSALVRDYRKTHPPKK